MSGLFLALSLAGLMPFAALAPDSLLAIDARLEPRTSGGLHLEVELDVQAGGALDELGRTLGRGVAIGEAHLGIGGQPGSPFLSNFLHAHEVRFTQLDPVALASSLRIELSFDLD